MDTFSVPHDPMPVVHYFAYFLDGALPKSAQVDALVERTWELIDGLDALRVALAPLHAGHGDSFRDQHLRIGPAPAAPSVVMDTFFALDFDEENRDALARVPRLMLSAPNRAASDPAGLLVGMLAAEVFARSGHVLVHDWDVVVRVSRQVTACA